MKQLAFVFPLVAALLCGQEIALNYKPTFKSFAPRDFQLTQDETFLINYRTAVLEFDQGGNVVEVFKAPENHLVDNFSYVPELPGLVMCSRLEGEKYWEVNLFDRQGRLEGIIAKKFIAGFIPFEGRLFKNLWSWDTTKETNPPLLVEVVLKSEELLGFKEKGRPFSPRKAEATRFTNDFRRKWIARDLSNMSGLVVADELQNRVWVYEDSGSGAFREVGFPNMHLSYRVQPTSFFDSDSNSYNKWLYSFSRLTGFYNFGGTYLVGYIRPNPHYDWYEKETKSSPFILVVQQLDSKFQEIGEPLQFEGGFLIGAADYGVAYIFRPEGSKITIITYKDFPG